MKIEPFALERWMTQHELNVTYDIAESGMVPLRLTDLLAWDAQTDTDATLRGLLDLPLGYSEARGTHARVATPLVGDARTTGFELGHGARFWECGPGKPAPTLGSVPACSACTLKTSRCSPPRRIPGSRPMRAG